MLADLFPTDQIYLACGYTDMRKSIDGLAALVTLEYNLDPYENCLFLFCGRRSDRIKALYWEGDGFLLLYKRLDSGKFQWPLEDYLPWSKQLPENCLLKNRDADAENE
jgi:transposase